MTLQITDWNKQALSGKKISEKESKNFVDWIYNELQPNEDSFSKLFIGIPHLVGSPA